MPVNIQDPPGLENFVREMKTGGGLMLWPLDLSYIFRHFDILTNCLIDYPLIALNFLDLKLSTHTADLNMSSTLGPY